MKRQDKIELALFGGLVVAGSLTRILLSDLPNFAPVAAIALFAGYFFRSRTVALLVPFSVMAISDCFLGSYGWQMMAVVYGGLMLPVFARGLLRKWFSGENQSAWATSAGLITSSLGASIAFFAISNFGAWIYSSTYEHTIAGLTHCYVQGIPFFRYTLAGDFCFALVLFGTYAVSMSMVAATAPTPAVSSK